MFSRFFDAVLMLTMSDWRTEPRSNRYHYAKRFSSLLPVIFVQPDNPQEDYYFEPTELPNVIILHLYETYGSRQNALLQRALREKKVLKPLLWIYNFLFLHVIEEQYSPLKVYHASENYFCEEFSYLPADVLRMTLQHIDLLVAVSEGVRASYYSKGDYKGDSIVLTNGCDYKFWSDDADIPNIKNFIDKKIVLYQGGINYRLDMNLLHDLLTRMPDWEFRFCGTEYFKQSEGLDEWNALKEFSNVTCLGSLDVEEVKKESYNATVGIIPFTQTEFIAQSFPLKAFEYVACGLPVVSVPIAALDNFPALFDIAITPDEFETAIRRAASKRYEPDAIERRRKEARNQDYDGKFTLLCEKFELMLTNPKCLEDKPLNILVLYAAQSVYVATTREYLESFSRYSPHNVFYTNAVNGAPCDFDFSLFDVVVINYSVRLSLDWYLSPPYAEGLRCFGGLKILFIQDEYENTNTACDWIEQLGIHAVFTCVPKKYVDAVYPSKRFPYTEFVQVLTGYVPLALKSHEHVKPLSERKYLIGYRGRPLPYRYGMLAQEKFIIGKKMREICDARNLVTNIEWDEDKRIYGDAWYEFIEDCRAMLGTESGSNVFDYDGAITTAVNDALQKNPELTFEEIFDRYLKEHEGKVMMNQISPKMFEAISLRTALVLFEGSYSGILKPHVHYIPLKKDFSNVDDVLSRLQDITYLETITQRAYEDIIKSGEYSYQEFIENVNAFVSQRLRKGKGIKLILSICFIQCPDDGQRKVNVSNLVWTEPVSLTELPHEMLSPAAVDSSDTTASEPVEMLSPAAVDSSDAVVTDSCNITEQKTIKSVVRKIWEAIPLAMRSLIKAMLKIILKKLWSAMPYAIRQKLKIIILQNS